MKGKLTVGVRRSLSTLNPWPSALTSETRWIAFGISKPRSLLPFAHAIISSKIKALTSSLAHTYSHAKIFRAGIRI